LAGCRPAVSSTPVVIVDFIKQFDRADRRPDAAFSLTDHVISGTGHAAILATAPSRLTWSLPLPRNGAFRAVVAATGPAPVRVRVGVSDARIYEGLAEATLTPGSGWSTITADLSAYAGWKFSLFYQPERLAWRVNLSADAIAGAPGQVAWGSPEIVTNTADALEYLKRRARLAP
ncbi:MAG TPA: hypothetical protein VNC21_08545, partial [Vicinamibacterales bacterium]|nr:hypothetical protein [Vicinamibacterales bacterium]